QLQNVETLQKEVEVQESIVASLKPRAIKGFTKAKLEDVKEKIATPLVIRRLQKEVPKLDKEIARINDEIEKLHKSDLSQVNYGKYRTRVSERNAQYEQFISKRDTVEDDIRSLRGFGKERARTPIEVTRREQEVIKL